VAYFSTLKIEALCSSELTTWSRVLLKKLTVPQTLKKFPTGSLSHSQQPILSQKNPVHTLPFYCFKIHCDIVCPSMPRSSKLPLSFRLPYQNPVCLDLLLQTRHMPCSFNPSLFLHLNNIQQIK